MTSNTGSDEHARDLPPATEALPSKSAESGDLLARWLADEEDVLARISAMRADAAPDRTRFATLPGIALFEAMLAGEIAGSPIGRTLDFLPIAFEPGHAVFQGRPLERHYNPIGSVHGGWIATLLDSALGCSVHTALPPGRIYTTLELKVNMVRAVTTRIARVRAEGRTIHVGNQVATAEARLIGCDGKLYAHGTTTCLVLPARP